MVAVVSWSGRRAGQVRRYHTLPTIQTQTVADHCWHVLRIYMEIWGSPPEHVTPWIVHHDSAECVVGDVPFGAKASLPRLGSDLAAAEEGIVVSNVQACAEHRTDPVDDWRIKACDLLEMVEFGWEELRLGNTLGEEIARNAGRALLRHCERPPEHLPPEDIGRVSEKLGAAR